MTLFAFALLAAALLALTYALFSSQQASAKRKELGLKGTVVYQDAGLKSQVFRSQRHHLKGKPDLLIKVEGVIIPVDKKPGKKRKPYPGQAAQLAAYCLLVHEDTGVRPPYGIIRYDDGDFIQPYTDAVERRLLEVVEEMRAVKAGAAAHRNHQSINKCKKCGFRASCEEKLT